MKLTAYILTILLCMSCTEQKLNNKVSFYHWKAKATFNSAYENALKRTQTETIYLHYFDIEQVNTMQRADEGIYPTYTLSSVAKEYKNFDIVPVVYIANQVFQVDEVNIQSLANKISKLIHQISNKWFDKSFNSIQIDCDWTKTTQHNYFTLLTELSAEFNIDVTIRLHQIKFKKETGVPPVKSGTLMLYNVGDLKNSQQNSILEASIVEQYINSKTSYPMPLKVALPLFSQTILTNHRNEIKILKNTDRKLLSSDKHFRKINNTNFEVAKDTLYQGFYLSKGFNLKLEEINESVVVESFKVLKRSSLHLGAVVFYYLDSEVLSTMDLSKIINEL